MIPGRAERLMEEETAAAAASTRAGQVVWQAPAKLRQGPELAIGARRRRRDVAHGNRQIRAESRREAARNRKPKYETHGLELITKPPGDGPPP